MQLSIAVPFLIAVLGALLYLFAKKTKVETLGLVLFAVGMYWTVPEMTRGAPASVGMHR